MFISCSTSPSAMTLVASASTSSTRMRSIDDHHLEGARVEEVAHQHAGGVAEDGVGGGAPATQGRLVDHVVVQQRGGVDELDDRGRQLVALGPSIAQGVGEQQHQRAAGCACRPA
jgi:hypothetical protein